VIVLDVLSGGGDAVADATTGGASRSLFDDSADTLRV
jgi:hypothetical protein